MMVDLEEKLVHTKKRMRTERGSVVQPLSTSRVRVRTTTPHSAKFSVALAL
jgi:hypothetical protein